MTNSILVAETVKNALNVAAAGFSESFVATREYQVISELKDLSALRVTVVYGGNTASPRFRGKDNEEHVVKIGIMKKPAAITNACFDAYALLVEEIFRWTKRTSITLKTGTNGVWLESSFEFLDQYLKEMNQFAAVVTVRYLTVG